MHIRYLDQIYARQSFTSLPYHFSPNFMCFLKKIKGNKLLSPFTASMHMGLGPWNMGRFSGHPLKKTNPPLATITS